MNPPGGLGAILMPNGSSRTCLRISTPAVPNAAALYIVSGIRGWSGERCQSSAILTVQNLSRIWSFCALHCPGECLPYLR